MPEPRSDPHLLHHEPDAGAVASDNPKEKKKQKNLAYAAVALGVVGTIFAWLTLRKSKGSTTGGYSYPTTSGTGQLSGSDAASLQSLLSQGLYGLQLGQNSLEAQLAALPYGSTGPASGTNTPTSTTPTTSTTSAAPSSAIPLVNNASGVSFADAFAGASPTQVGAQPPPSVAYQVPDPIPGDTSTVLQGSLGGSAFTYGGPAGSAQGIMDQIGPVQLSAGDALPAASGVSQLYVNADGSSFRYG